MAQSSHAGGLLHHLEAKFGDAFFFEITGKTDFHRFRSQINNMPILYDLIYKNTREIMNICGLYTKRARFFYHRNGFIMVDFCCIVINLYAFFEKQEKLDIPLWPANR